MCSGMEYLNGSDVHVHQMAAGPEKALAVIWSTHKPLTTGRVLSWRSGIFASAEHYRRNALVEKVCPRGRRSGSQLGPPSVLLGDRQGCRWL